MDPTSSSTARIKRPYIPETCGPYVRELEQENERLRLNLEAFKQKVLILDRKYEKALSLLATAQGRST